MFFSPLSEVVAVQNLTVHGPEQPAAADPALSRCSGLDCLQTCLMLMLTDFSPQQRWSSAEIHCKYWLILQGDAVSFIINKKISEKAVPIVSSVVKTAQQSQVEHKTGDVFTMHPLGWMPRTFLAPPIILYENGDIQLHRDIAGLPWMLAPYRKK